MTSPDAVLSSRYGTLSVESSNVLLSRLSDSQQMTPWEVIEEALLRKRPARNMKWLAEQLDETIQVVSNWKKRGVPARRFRDIGKVLGLSVDQIEGLEALPWETSQEAGLLPDVADLAQTINQLPEQQRKYVIQQTRMTISYLPDLFRTTTEESVKPEPKQSASPERARKLR
jgi:hypothetical protein